MMNQVAGDDKWCEMSRNCVHTVHTSSSFLLKKENSSQLLVEPGPQLSQAAKPIEAFDDADDSVYWPRGFLLDRSKLGAVPGAGKIIDEWCSLQPFFSIF